jgi:hypothetical protein
MTELSGPATGVGEVGEGATAAARAVQFEADPTTAFEMALTADLYVRRVESLDGSLDYSDASIATAEELGVATYNAQCGGLSHAELREFQGTLVLELGAYIGETFIRNHGGDWGWEAMPGGRAFGLRSASGLTTFPLTKAKKRLLGNFGSLVAFYEMLVRWPETGE